MEDLREIFTIEFIKKALKNPLSVFDNTFVRYVTIGGSTFMLDFGIYQLAVKVFDSKEIIANLLSVFLSLFFNFTLTNFWTFNSQTSIKAKKLTKYILLAVFNYFFNNFMFIFFTVTLDWNGLLSKIIITAIIVSWNFLIYKLWVFKEE